MTDASAPQAVKKPAELERHGDVRVDDWYWLREKDNPEVTAHLEAENSYTAKMMESTNGAQERLFEEIVGRIQETDLSVPVRKAGWWYYQRTEEGKQYGIHCRRADIENSATGEEVVILDENVEAEGFDFFSMGAFDISPDGNLLAYNIDTAGDEVFTMRVRDLATGTDLPDVIERTAYGSAWAKDGSVLFYTRQDDTMRPFQVWRHVMGTPAASDAMIFQEDDERFFIGVGNTKTDDYITINVGSSLTSEVHLLSAASPLGDFQVVEPRRQGVEYHVSHHRSPAGDRLFITTNDHAPNFKLMETSINATRRQHWTEVIGHRDDVKLDGVDAFADFLVLAERAEATARIALLDLATMERRVIEQSEPVYTARASGNAEFETRKLRFEYTSFVTPRSVYVIDLDTDERVLLKQQPVLGDYDPKLYVSERQWATATDGTKIPVSLVYRRDRAEGPGPTMLYGYGSYEISMDVGFSSLRLSLLNRGFVFAIAHVRGGGDMGRLWYEHGKFLEKKNTFTDFIACAEHLIDAGYTEPSKLVMRGGSAGGLLMGAVSNLRPDLFAAVIAEVPFVDVLTTMLDTSLPLTVHEFEEWGNPAEKPFYDYIKSYSPYDNVEAQDYPTMLVTGGLNDPRVSYWEPTKWVQKLRENNTNENLILLKTEMGAGHMGPSGRYDSWRDEAFVYAFCFQALGLPLTFA